MVKTEGNSYSIITRGLQNKTIQEIKSSLYNYCDDQISLLNVESKKRRIEICKTFIMAATILLTCLFISNLIEKNNIFGAFISTVISEGLFIIGWVSLWHPIELFLYHNWFERYDKSIYTFIKECKIKIEESKEETL